MQSLLRFKSEFCDSRLRRCLAFKHVVSTLRNDLLGTCQPMSTSASGSPNNIPGDKFHSYRSLELRGSSFKNFILKAFLVMISLYIYLWLPTQSKNIFFFLIPKHQVSL